MMKLVYMVGVGGYLDPPSELVLMGKVGVIWTPLGTAAGGRVCLDSADVCTLGDGGTDGRVTFGIFSIL